MATNSLSKFDRLYSRIFEDLQEDDLTFYFWKCIPNPVPDFSGVKNMIILAYNNMTFDKLFGQDERLHKPDSEVWDNMSQWKLYQLEGGKTSPNAFMNAVKNNKTFVLPDMWIDFDGESAIFVSRDYNKLIKLINNYYKIGSTMKPIFVQNAKGSSNQYDFACGKVPNNLPVFIEYLDDPEKYGQYVTNITFANIKRYTGDNQFSTLADMIPGFGEPPDPADDWKNDDDDDE